MKRAPLFFLILFSLPSFVHAGRTELGLQGGWLFIEGDSNLRDDFVYGGRLGKYVTDRLELQFSYLVGESKIRQTNKRANLQIPMAELEYDLSSSAWRPYVAAGVGAMESNRNRSVSRNEIDFVAHYGAGVKWMFCRNFLWRLDGRHLINSESGRGTHMGLFTTGISWIYGGTEPATIVKQTIVADADGDGVLDDRDECPGTKKEVNVDARGCPVDTDGDGVTDDKDKCPDTPSGTVVDWKGCPKDSDQDGVLDEKDQCPNTPKGKIVDDAGCPVEAAVPEKEWVLQHVNFEPGSDRLVSGSLASLDKAVEILSAHTTVRIEIQGHTDSNGKVFFNKNLSLRRADAVRKYLIGKGISPDRMSVEGFGESKPVASNKTPVGRARNRRIEFKVLSR